LVFYGLSHISLEFTPQGFDYEVSSA